MLKRAFDLLLSLVLLIILSPILITISLLVFLFLGSPILFSQERPGYKEKIFHIYKFRSMRDIADKDGKLLPDEQRITALGKFIRATSIDELPELWNIFIGQMSFVGPRPLLVKYLPLYNEQQRKRHDVRPGLTGWAQINGRNSLSWYEKFELDVYYVENANFWFDLKILFLTAVKVIKREGISQEGFVSADEFNGHN